MEERVIIEEDVESPSNAFIHRHRCCFQLPCFGSSPSTTTRHITFGGPSTSSGSSTSFFDRFRSAETEDHWWARPFWAFKKVREWSEIVVGPKWKTFIRRFNSRRHNHRHQAGKFQYNPLSYALNFGEGPGQNGNFDEDVVVHFPDFSSRLAAVRLSSSKLPSELGNGALAC